MSYLLAGWKLFLLLILFFSLVFSKNIDPSGDITGKNTNSTTCYPNGKPSMCLPRFTSMAYGRTPEVSSTCGMEGEEQYCIQTSVQASSSHSGYCGICDQSSARLAHDAKKLTDFNRDKEFKTFWQSQSLESARSKSSRFVVNITIDLGIQSQITYMWLRFKSPRPQSMAIYRKRTSESDWEPWGFFSRSCQAQYGRPANQKLVQANRTKPVCLSGFSDMVPLSDGDVGHILLAKRIDVAKPGPYDNSFWGDPLLQVRVRGSGSELAG